MLNVQVRNNMADTVVGQRGILTLDLDLYPNLVSFGLARVTPPRPGLGIPSESGWRFNPQDARGELVMAVVCPEIGGGGGTGVESIGVPITKVHAGFMVDVRGTSALTPALSRSGEGERSATWRRGGRARLAWRLAPEIRELPESRCDFVVEDIGGELLISRDCPELSVESIAVLAAIIPAGGVPCPGSVM